MSKRFLEECLAKGMSLETIGKQVARHPSTVSYWLKKYGLTAAGRARHAPKGKVDPARMRSLTANGASIAAIADELGVSKSTVRYWLRRLGLQTTRAANPAVCSAQRRLTMVCPVHGPTTFHRRSDGGGYRCGKCSSLAVMNRRRKIKLLLVAEAGGKCRICGFAEHPAALHFHHRDPEQKEFQLGHPALSRSLERMCAEARKCVLLCANCHAMVEAGVMNSPVSAR